jgi:hypothetical protein
MRLNGVRVGGESIAHAQQFNVEVVWRDYWMPFLRNYFAS